MSDTIIRVENVSKLYRLGVVGTGTLSHDLNRWWHAVRGRENPYLKIGQTNDRTKKGNSDYSWALQDINFEVKRGEVLGIIGRNGAGKSTLLKILSRVTTPTTGTIKIKGRVASLLEVGTGFNPDLTGRENIYLNGAILGMRKREIDRKFDEIVAFSGIERYVDTPVKRYSSGMYVRLAFAVAAHLEPEILIVDEVLAVGDAEFQRKCLGKMKDVSGNGRTILFVSHNMKAVQTLCHKGLVLEHGRVKCLSNAEEALRFYSKFSEMRTSVTFEGNKARPCIRSVAIDAAELEIGNLVVDIGFYSPYVMNPPVPGLLVTSALGTPVFGSNPRFHRQGYGEARLSEGVIRMTMKQLPIHGGVYKLSVWLGDWTADYQEIRDVLTFEFKGGHLEVNTPNPENFGFLNSPASWSVMDAK